MSQGDQMKRGLVLEIDLQEHAIRWLDLQDIEDLQRLYEACNDFNLLVEGLPADKDAAERTFQDLPPGKTMDDKFLWGVFHKEHGLVGILDAVRGYPEEGTWWIGLLLLDPEVRSVHIGEKIVQGFVEFVKKMGGSAVMLGVVEENTNALRFWKRMGFEFVRQTEPRGFGKKEQKVNVMRLVW